MANTYLTKTFASGGSTTKWTYSVWLKRSKLSYDTANIFGRYQSSSYFTGLYFSATDGIQFLQKNAGSNAGRLMTSDVYRDTSAWYHIVAVWDSANSTANDRMKIYVNGVSPTIVNRINPSSGLGSTWNTANPNNDIGRANGMDSNTNYFDGVMSHIHFCDGYAYSASDFGETDATTGEWKIKTSPSVSYGTTGFNILKDGNSVTDTSPNSNNFTVGGGTLTATEDCPGDVFATMNPLNVPTSNAPIFTNGNTYGKSATGGTQASAFSGSSTLGMTAGKYYIEAKAVVIGDSRSGVGISGEASTQAKNNDGGSGLSNSSYLYTSEAGTIYSPSGNISGHPSYANNDIIGIAVDVTNLKVYFSKNGVFENSHNPSAGSGGISLTALASTTDGAYFVGGGSTAGGGAASAYSAMYFNFGNGYFGTTQITGTTYSPTVGNTGAVFKYAVPTNYTALSTKGLNA